MDEIKNVKNIKKKSYLRTERVIIELQVHLFFIFRFPLADYGAGVSGHYCSCSEP